MKVSTVGISALQEVTAIKGLENSVIAGGFVRDSVLGGQFTDIDIFIPKKSFNSIDLEPLYKNFTDWDFRSNKKQRYGVLKNNFEKYDVKYMGSVDVDFVVMDIPDGPDFGSKVIDTFQYGIDRTYCNSEGEIITSKEFDRDAKYMEASLLFLNSIEDIPGIIGKYFKLKTKYPDFIWRHNGLISLTKDLNKEENTVKKTTRKRKLIDINELL